jgi:hypothetical protein
MDHDTVGPSSYRRWKVPGADTSMEIPRLLLGHLEPDTQLAATFHDTGRDSARRCAHRRRSAADGGRRRPEPPAESRRSGLVLRGYPADFVCCRSSRWSAPSIPNNLLLLERSGRRRYALPDEKAQPYREYTNAAVGPACDETFRPMHPLPISRDVPAEDDGWFGWTQARTRWDVTWTRRS